MNPIPVFRPPRESIVRFWLLATVIAVGAPAQDDPEPVAFREIATPDGSRFLLVPDRPEDAVPVVHWVAVAPAGAAEDPAGLEGLSTAVARASLNGTIAFGSTTDWLAERDALDGYDRIRERIASLQYAGSEVPIDLSERAEELENTLDALSDPDAWRRAMRAAPAVGLELRETAAATMLHIATTPAALPRVARLLYDRRENAQLRGWRAELEAVRSRLVEQADEPHRVLSREILGLAFPGHPGARPIGPSSTRVSREIALRTFAATHQPWRGYHVLTGGFDIDEVATLLSAVFRSTSVPELPTPPARAARGGSERRATVSSPVAAGVAIGFLLPDDLPDAQADILGEWLTGPGFGVLSRALRAAGFDAEPRYAASFPASLGPRLLLVQAIDTGPSIERAEPTIDEVVLTALDIASEKPPDAAPILAATRAVAGRRACDLSNPTALASHLAIACGVRRTPPGTELAKTVEDADLASVATRIFTTADRTIVKLERVR